MAQTPLEIAQEQYQATLAARLAILAHGQEAQTEHGRRRRAAELAQVSEDIKYWSREVARLTVTSGAAARQQTFIVVDP